MTLKQNTVKTTRNTTPSTKQHTGQLRYNIEYFHIYTDENIGDVHQASLNYLKAARHAWNFDTDLTLLIDNYNPTKHTLKSSTVLDYLKKEGMQPKYWAFEADFVENAKVLLEKLNDSKLKRSYQRYIETKNKYPCSLLTASWYLTRLGYLDSSMIKSQKAVGKFQPSDRIINILPEAYKAVEFRAHELILRSEFSEAASKIQDLFYPADAHLKIDLF